LRLLFLDEPTLNQNATCRNGHRVNLASWVLDRSTANLTLSRHLKTAVKVLLAIAVASIAAYAN
jgi:hypothetical protein